MHRLCFQNQQTVYQFVALYGLGFGYITLLAACFEAICSLSTNPISLINQQCFTVSRVGSPTNAPNTGRRVKKETPSRTQIYLSSSAPRRISYQLKIFKARLHRSSANCRSKSDARFLSRHSALDESTWTSSTITHISRHQAKMDILSTRTTVVSMIQPDQNIGNGVAVSVIALHHLKCKGCLINE